MPVMPQLCALKRDPEEIPVSESSATSSASLRGGGMRAHPYHPVGGAIDGSSFEIVPSAANQATSATGFDESIDLAPIARTNSSPGILHNPMQAMSPNLVARSASLASHPTRSLISSVAQQWAEVKTEDGTVERTYTQRAQDLAPH